MRLDFPPPLDVAATVAERRGCDPNPLDPTEEDTRLTLLSYIWPDQRWRLALLQAALDAAASVPAVVDRAFAGDWLAERLAEPAEGRATVVFHSIVMQYLPEAERARVEALPARGGRAGDALGAARVAAHGARHDGPRRRLARPVAARAPRAGRRRPGTTGGRWSGRAGEPVASLYAG